MFSQEENCCANLWQSSPFQCLSLLFLKVHANLWSTVLVLLKFFSNLGGLCRSEVNVSIIQGTYSWPYKKPGQSVSQKCQYGSAGQNVTRLCNGNLTWTENASKCPTVLSAQLNLLVENVCIFNTQCSGDFSLLIFSVFLANHQCRKCCPHYDRAN